jgi:HPr kinase/phosphorylase
MNKPNPTVVHGVFMNIFGLGTLITGESGSGKSELALSLLDRGHQLIADDAPQFEVDNDGKQLIGSCPTPLQNLLEIRGLGIFDLSLIYGQRALMHKQVLSLVIALQKTETIPRKTHDQPAELRPIMNIHIPHITLPYNQERSLDIILETLVRYHLHQVGLTP